MRKILGVMLAESLDPIQPPYTRETVRGADPILHGFQLDEVQYDALYRFLNYMMDLDAGLVLKMHEKQLMRSSRQTIHTILILIHQGLSSSITRSNKDH